MVLTKSKKDTYDWQRRLHERAARHRQRQLFVRLTPLQQVLHFLGV